MIIVPRPWVRALIILAATGLVAHCSRTETETFPILSGPYLGQMPPGKEAQIFAPDIVSTGFHNRDVAMLPDGSELYFGLLHGTSGLATGRALPTCKRYPAATLTGRLIFGGSTQQLLRIYALKAATPPADGENALQLAPTGGAQA